MVLKKKKCNRFTLPVETEIALLKHLLAVAVWPGTGAKKRERNRIHEITIVNSNNLQ